MVCVLLVGSACLAFSADNSVASPPRDADRAAYEAVKAKAGRDPDAQVGLALWCEAHGLTAERIKHLARAVLSDPTHSTARGLLGLVPFNGRWQTPEAVAARVNEDEARNADMARYEGRRARMADTADAHWKMAVWCQEQGLEPEAKAHLAIVVQLDPGREAAWKRLGYKRDKNRWVTEAQLAAEKAEANAQKAADKHYKPLLAKWRGWLGDKDQARRAEADDGLAALTDPRAVPAVWLTFAPGNATQQRLAVQVLGQIDSPGSSRALALMAVFSPVSEVRGRASEMLKRRDPRDFAGLLIDLLQDPVKYEVRPVGGPGSPGALFVNGNQFNVQYLYSPPPMPEIPLFPGERFSYDAAGLPVVSRYLGPNNLVSTTTVIVTPSQFLGSAPPNPQDRTQLVARARDNSTAIGGLGMDPILRNVPRASVAITETTRTQVESTVQIPIGQIALEYQKSAMAAQEQLAADIHRLDSFNAEVRESNHLISQVLAATTGRATGDTREDWRAWWTDFLGYSYTRPPNQPRPTIVEDVPLAYTPQPVPVFSRVAQLGPPVSTIEAQSGIGASCFAAGTPVRTLTGERPIESLLPGDQVLTQDTTTGKLSFQPVVGIYHNKPSALLRIRFGAETIGATPIHRFWKVGVGWTMARDLKPGDAIRTTSGPMRVASVEQGSVEPVFNLKVAEGQTFFVGKQRFLVHDNSLVQPVLRPFDAVPELAAPTAPSSAP